MRSFDFISHLLFFTFRLRLHDFTPRIRRRTGSELGTVLHLLETLPPELVQQASLLHPPWARPHGPAAVGASAEVVLAAGSLAEGSRLGLAGRGACGALGTGITTRLSLSEAPEGITGSKTYLSVGARVSPRRDQPTCCSFGADAGTDRQRHCPAQVWSELKWVPPRPPLRTA